MRKLNNRDTEIGIYELLHECDYKSKYGNKLYRVKCKMCGYETEATYSQIKRYSQICHHKNKFNRYIFGEHTVYWKNKRIQIIFSDMKDRCYNENCKDYKWYGAKNIKIYDEWLLNPSLFENWAINNGYKENLTIDRIDSSKDYSPENCRWILKEDSAKYKSTTNLIEVNGEIHSGRDWSKICNLGINTINKMFKKYGEHITKEFIKARLKDMTKIQEYNTNWLDLYNIVYSR